MPSVRGAGPQEKGGGEMEDHFESAAPFAAPAPPSKRSRWWVWVVAAVGGVMLSCAGCVGVLAWLGITGPDTAVYAGNSVPERFVETMRDLGAIEDGEQLLYFYSDAFVNIENGFYFISDRKIAVYSRDVEPHLTTVLFEDIVDVQLYRDESFFVDSEIVIEMSDGTPLAFPVSSEYAGDTRFFEAIRDRVPAINQ